MMTKAVSEKSTTVWAVRTQDAEGLDAGAGCAVLLPVACAGISVLACRLAQPDTVVFDMRGTVNGFKQQSAQMTLTPERAASLTTRFIMPCKAAWQTGSRHITRWYWRRAQW